MSRRALELGYPLNIGDGEAEGYEESPVSSVPVFERLFRRLFQRDSCASLSVPESRPAIYICTLWTGILGSFTHECEDQTSLIFLSRVVRDSGFPSPNRSGSSVSHTHAMIYTVHVFVGRGFGGCHAEIPPGKAPLLVVQKAVQEGNAVVRVLGTCLFGQKTLTVS